MDGIPPPDGWVVYPTDLPDVQYDFWKPFPTPDGMEVDVYILKIQDKYQVKDIAASRSSGPYESIVVEVTTLDEAISAAFRECKDWDVHVARLLNKRNQKPSQKSDTTA